MITKADALISLKPHLTRGRIEEIRVVTVREFYNDEFEVVTSVMRAFKGELIVVRSSSSNEDAFAFSNAGHYESVLHVDSASYEAVKTAIDTVIRSYADIEDVEKEQVLIQKQTMYVAYSGVIFTREIKDNRPYYLLNYDDKGSTDAVTSGAGGKVLWIARDVALWDLPEHWAKLVTAVREIEQILSDSLLDIEYAITHMGEVVIFQVRPLAANYNKQSDIDDWTFIITKQHFKNLYSYSRHYRTNLPMMLSDMAFWNPSEIIGNRPHPLDYSLYREIVTENIWSNAMINLGYRNVPYDLMYRIGNKPYISLDYAFEGLTPKEIPEELAQKMFAYYRLKINKDITAHDKVEFEIIYNCYHFMTSRNIVELRDNGFTTGEVNTIIAALKNLTNNAIKKFSVMYAEDEASLKELHQVRKQITQKKPYEEKDPAVLIGYVKTLIEHIKTNGTPQFTRIARLAFIAKELCQKAVMAGHFTNEEMDKYMETMHTVSAQFQEDFDRYCAGEMSREDFNQTYGHLRLGTYDIRSECYNDLDFKTEGMTSHVVEKQGKELDHGKLKAACESIGLDISPKELLYFIKTSIEQREKFKFEFTKSLSMALEILIQFGKVCGISRNDMSYLEYPDLLEETDYTKFAKLIDERKTNYHLNNKLLLPEVILSVMDIDVIEAPEARPNFITSDIVQAPVVLLEEDPKAEITGKIVVVTKADPGYDWIFAKGIAGFVTKYGGVASHMAIRCAEFHIPAAIGCGKKIFNDVCSNGTIELDCKNKKISKIAEIEGKLVR